MKLLVRVLALSVVLGVVAVPATPGVGAAHPNGAARSTTWVTVIRWGDGDTVDTSRGKVRLIGIDTPELGQCGAAEAHQRVETLAPAGSKIRLVDPRSVRNKDRYGRLLRYVEISGRDVGLVQIKKGARARYDSRTGYDHHPRQAKYVRVDKKYGSPCKNQATGGGAPNTGSGSYAPLPGGHDCPAHAPIKGNQGSNGWIYHQPWNQYYSVTNPEECFATAAAAESAGYRAAKV